MSFKRLFLVSLVSLASLAFFDASAQAQTDPGIRDTISVADVQVNAGDHFPLTVRIFNDENLTGGTIGLRWGDPDLFLDSVSFTGGLLESVPTFQKPVTIDNAINHEVLTGFFLFGGAPIPPSSTIWATLWLTVNPSAPDKIVPFDSAKIQPAGDFILSSETGISITPEYIKGTVTIGNPASNTAPVLAAIPPQTVAEGANLNFTVSATDAESVPTLSASPLTNATFVDNGDGTGTFDFNPDFTQAGALSVTFIASDGEFADTISVAINVTNTNRAPVWVTVPPRVVNEGDSLSFVILATDPDGDALTLSQVSLPVNASFVDNGDGTGAVTFVPDFTQAGDYTFTFAADDAPGPTLSLGGRVVATLDVQVTVNNVNRAPVITPTADTSMNVGETLVVDILATDADGDSIILAPVSMPATSSFSHTGPGAVRVTVGASAIQAGTDLTVIISATDGIASVRDTFIIAVNPLVIPDSAFITPDTLSFTMVEGASTTLIGKAFLSSTNAPAAYTAVVSNNADPLIATLFDSVGVTDDTVRVSVGLATLAPGLYHNTVACNVSGVDNNPVNLVISLLVEAVVIPDTAVFAPDTLWFTATEGETATQTGCSFLTSSNAPAQYAFVDTSIFSFARPIDTLGMTDDTVCISVDPSSMAVGTYYTTLNYSVAEILGGFTQLTACLIVEPAAMDTSVLAISDTLFSFVSSVDTPFIAGDSVRIFNAGPGPDFGWTITNISCTYDECFPYMGPDTPPCFDTSVVISISPDSSGITVAPLNGTTPAYAFINVDNQNLAPGTYTCTFTVSGAQGVQNSPQEFTVEFVVKPTVRLPMSVMSVSPTSFNHVVVAGEPNVISDTLEITNIGDGPDFGWHINLDSAYCNFVPLCPPNMPFCGDTIRFSGIDFAGFGPINGTTPSVLTATFATDTLLPGEYWCFFDVVADSANVGSSPQTVSAHLTVLPPPRGPSTDTLYISTVPATPGSKVKVPVNLINNGPVCKLDIPLTWASSQIFLDSVSFAGTRLDGIAKTDFTFDNGARKVTITFDAVNLALPVGSGRIAYMFFDVFSGITDGGLVPIDRAGAVTSGDCSKEGLAPEFFPGGIVIDSSGNVICGRVVDTAGNEIAGATVQVWDNFPGGTFYAEDTTLLDGSFKFNELFVVPYTLYGFAEGYYPNTVEDINFGTCGLEVVLTPVSPVQPTNEWVEFYCNTNTYKGVPLPVGSVVDAFDPDGDHVGTWFVSEAGKYGFMPIYRDDAFTPEDDGADPGDTITLYINGMPAEATGARVWTQNGDRFEVCLNFDGSVSKEILLTPGWNLISWNVDTDVDDIETIFGPVMAGIDVILSFEEVGLTYDPALPDFSTLTSADHLHGYWVRVDSAAMTLNIDGLPALVNTPINLETGWNLVSYLPPVSLPIGSALVSQEGNLRVALGFDGGALTYEPSLPEFSTLNTLSPCFGYWLKVFDASTLVYPGFNSAPFIEQDENTEGDVLARMGVANELSPTGSWIDIYASELTLDGSPISAGSEIRIVDANQRLVGYGRTASSGKLMFTPVYGSSSENESGLKAGESFSLVVDGKATNESFTFGQRGDRLEIGALTLREGVDGVTLPTEFNLSQNYPNPFNPSTQISFSLPKASEVTIEVFNVLGKRVATLLSGSFEAGQSTVTWDAVTDDGEPVASGMYFYRLKAGSFTQTRKMVLLK